MNAARPVTPSVPICCINDVRSMEIRKVRVCAASCGAQMLCNASMALAAP
jgi:hypothetical protein